MSHMTKEPTICATTRAFLQSEIDSGIMATYIQNKAKNFHQCHVFDYAETFSLESSISRSTQ